MGGNDVGDKLPTAGDGDVNDSEAGPGMDCGELGLDLGLELGLEPGGELKGNPGPKRLEAPPGPKMLNGSSAAPGLAPAAC